MNIKENLDRVSSIGAYIFVLYRQNNYPLTKMLTTLYSKTYPE